MQHLKYIAHVTRLDNGSFQKQLLFSCQHKKYSRDRWPKIEKDLGVCKMQIQKTMQNKKEFMSLLHHTFSVKTLRGTKYLIENFDDDDDDLTILNFS